MVKDSKEGSLGAHCDVVGGNRVEDSHEGFDRSYQCGCLSGVVVGNIVGTSGDCSLVVDMGVRHVGIRRGNRVGTIPPNSG